MLSFKITNNIQQMHIMKKNLMLKKVNTVGYRLSSMKVE